jgi:hypothetical protein
VAEADLPRLTDRFYRGESSRTTPGNGLGLTLVSAVADLHGATLDLNVMKPGLRVTMPDQIRGQSIPTGYRVYAAAPDFWTAG